MCLDLKHNFELMLGEGLLIIFRKTYRVIVDRIVPVGCSCGETEMCQNVKRLKAIVRD